MEFRFIFNNLIYIFNYLNQKIVFLYFSKIKVNPTKIIKQIINTNSNILFIFIKNTKIIISISKIIKITLIIKNWIEIDGRLNSKLLIPHSNSKISFLIILTFKIIKFNKNKNRIIKILIQ